MLEGQRGSTQYRCSFHWTTICYLFFWRLVTHHSSSEPTDCRRTAEEIIYCTSIQIIGCSTCTFRYFPSAILKKCVASSERFSFSVSSANSCWFSTVCLMTPVTFCAIATGDLCAPLSELCMVIIRRSPLNCKFSQLYSPLSIHYFKNEWEIM